MNNSFPNLKSRIFNAFNLFYKLNIEKIVTVGGSLFLVFVITFSLYTVIRKNQQRLLQSTAHEILQESITTLAKNWDYADLKSSFSNNAIQKITGNNHSVFSNFSRLGHIVSNAKPVLLKTNPSLANSTLTIEVSYEVIANFENGQAIFLINLIDENDITVIDFINIDAVYFIYSAINTPFDVETSSDALSASDKEEAKRIGQIIDALDGNSEPGEAE